jgi:hypothetical protein
MMCDVMLVREKRGKENKQTQVWSGLVMLAVALQVALPWKEVEIQLSNWKVAHSVHGRQNSLN